MNLRKGEIGLTTIIIAASIIISGAIIGSGILGSPENSITPVTGLATTDNPRGGTTPTCVGSNYESQSECQQSCRTASPKGVCSEAGAGSSPPCCVCKNEEKSKYDCEQDNDNPDASTTTAELGPEGSQITLRYKKQWKWDGFSACSCNCEVTEDNVKEVNDYLAQYGGSVQLSGCNWECEQDSGSECQDFDTSTCSCQDEPKGCCFEEETGEASPNTQIPKKECNYQWEKDTEIEEGYCRGCCKSNEKPEGVPYEKLWTTAYDCDDWEAGKKPECEGEGSDAKCWCECEDIEPAKISESPPDIFMSTRIVPETESSGKLNAQKEHIFFTEIAIKAETRNYTKKINPDKNERAFNLFTGEAASLTDNQNKRTLASCSGGGVPQAYQATSEQTASLVQFVTGDTEDLGNGLYFTCNDPSNTPRMIELRQNESITTKIGEAATKKYNLTSNKATILCGQEIIEAPKYLPTINDEELQGMLNNTLTIDQLGIRLGLELPKDNLTTIENAKTLPELRKAIYEIAKDAPVKTPTGCPAERYPTGIPLESPEAEPAIYLKTGESLQSGETTILCTTKQQPKQSALDAVIAFLKGHGLQTPAPGSINIEVQAEYIEIQNPTDYEVKLDNYYLTDSSWRPTIPEHKTFGFPTPARGPPPGTPFEEDLQAESTQYLPETLEGGNTPASPTPALTQGPTPAQPTIPQTIPSTGAPGGGALGGFAGGTAQQGGPVSSGYGTGIGGGAAGAAQYGWSGPTGSGWSSAGAALGGGLPQYGAPPPTGSGYRMGGGASGAAQYGAGSPSQGGLYAGGGQAAIGGTALTGQATISLDEPASNTSTTNSSNDNVGSSTQCSPIPYSEPPELPTLGNTTLYYHHEGGGNRQDFHVKFPQGAKLKAKQTITIALNGRIVKDVWGFTPDYAILEPEGTKQMLPVFGGVDEPPKLDDSGETLLLYWWDGEGLVEDVDYLSWVGENEKDAIERQKKPRCTWKPHRVPSQDKIMQTFRKLPQELQNHFRKSLKEAKQQAQEKYQQLLPDTTELFKLYFITKMSTALQKLPPDTYTEWVHDLYENRKLSASQVRKTLSVQGVPSQEQEEIVFFLENNLNEETFSKNVLDSGKDWGTKMLFGKPTSTMKLNTEVAIKELLRMPVREFLQQYNLNTEQAIRDYIMSNVWYECPQCILKPIKQKLPEITARATQNIRTNMTAAMQNMRFNTTTPFKQKTQNITQTNTTADATTLLPSGRAPPGTEFLGMRYITGEQAELPPIQISDCDMPPDTIPGIVWVPEEIREQPPTEEETSKTPSLVFDKRTSSCCSVPPEGIDPTSEFTPPSKTIIPGRQASYAPVPEGKGTSPITGGATYNTRTTIPVQKQKPSVKTAISVLAEKSGMQNKTPGGWFEEIQKQSQEPNYCEGFMGVIPSESYNSKTYENAITFKEQIQQQTSGRQTSTTTPSNDLSDCPSFIEPLRYAKGELYLPAGETETISQAYEIKESGNLLTASLTTKEGLHYNIPFWNEQSGTPTDNEGRKLHYKESGTAKRGDTLVLTGKFTRFIRYDDYDPINKVLTLFDPATGLLQVRMIKEGELKIGQDTFKMRMLSEDLLEADMNADGQYASGAEIPIKLTDTTIYLTNLIKQGTEPQPKPPEWKGELPTLQELEKSCKGAITLKYDESKGCVKAAVCMPPTDADCIAEKIPCPPVPSIPPSCPNGTKLMPVIDRITGCDLGARCEGNITNYPVFSPTEQTDKSYLTVSEGVFGEDTEVIKQIPYYIAKYKIDKARELSKENPVETPEIKAPEPIMEAEYLPIQAPPPFEKPPTEALSAPEEKAVPEDLIELFKLYYVVKTSTGTQELPDYTYIMLVHDLYENRKLSSNNVKSLLTGVIPEAEIENTNDFLKTALDDDAYQTWLGDKLLDNAAWKLFGRPTSTLNINTENKITQLLGKPVQDILRENNLEDETAIKEYVLNNVKQECPMCMFENIRQTKPALKQKTQITGGATYNTRTIIPVEKQKSSLGTSLPAPVRNKTVLNKPSRNITRPEYCLRRKGPKMSCGLEITDKLLVKELYAEVILPDGTVITIKPENIKPVEGKQRFEFKELTQEGEYTIEWHSTLTDGTKETTTDYFEWTKELANAPVMPEKRPVELPPTEKWSRHGRGDAVDSIIIQRTCAGMEEAGEKREQTKIDKANSYITSFVRTAAVSDIQKEGDNATSQNNAGINVSKGGEQAILNLRERIGDFKDDFFNGIVIYPPVLKSGTAKQYNPRHDEMSEPAAANWVDFLAPTPGTPSPACNICEETEKRQAIPTSLTPLEQEPKNCMCPSTKYPVCGSNNKTYENECFAVCDGANYVLGTCGINSVEPPLQDNKTKREPNKNPLGCRQPTLPSGGCAVRRKNDPRLQYVMDYFENTKNLQKISERNIQGGSKTSKEIQASIDNNKKSLEEINNKISNPKPGEDITKLKKQKKSLEEAIKRQEEELPKKEQEELEPDKSQHGTDTFLEGVADAINELFFKKYEEDKAMEETMQSVEEKYCNKENCPEDTIQGYYQKNIKDGSPIQKVFESTLQKSKDNQKLWANKCELLKKSSEEIRKQLQDLNNLYSKTEQLVMNIVEGQKYQKAKADYTALQQTEFKKYAQHVWEDQARHDLIALPELQDWQEMKKAKIREQQEIMGPLEKEKQELLLAGKTQEAKQKQEEIDRTYGLLVMPGAEETALLDARMKQSYGVGVEAARGRLNALMQTFKTEIGKITEDVDWYLEAAGPPSECPPPEQEGCIEGWQERRSATGLVIVAADMLAQIQEEAHALDAKYFAIRTYKKMHEMNEQVKTKVEELKKGCYKKESPGFKGKLLPDLSQIYPVIGKGFVPKYIPSYRNGPTPSGYEPPSRTTYNYKPYLTIKHFFEDQNEFFRLKKKEAELRDKARGTGAAINMAREDIKKIIEDCQKAKNCDSKEVKADIKSLTEQISTMQNQLQGIQEEIMSVQQQQAIIAERLAKPSPVVNAYKKQLEQNKKSAQKQVDDAKKLLQDPKLTPEQKSQIQKRIDEINKYIKGMDKSITGIDETQKSMQKMADGLWKAIDLNAAMMLPPEQRTAAIASLLQDKRFSAPGEQARLKTFALQADQELLKSQVSALTKSTQLQDRKDALSIAESFVKESQSVKNDYVDSLKKKEEQLQKQHDELEAQAQEAYDKGDMEKAAELYDKADELDNQLDNVFGLIASADLFEAAMEAKEKGDMEEFKSLSDDAMSIAKGDPLATVFSGMNNAMNTKDQMQASYLSLEIQQKLELAGQLSGEKAEQMLKDYIDKNPEAIKFAHKKDIDALKKGREEATNKKFNEQNEQFKTFIKQKKPGKAADMLENDIESNQKQIEQIDAKLKTATGDERNKLLKEREERVAIIETNKQTVQQLRHEQEMYDQAEQVRNTPAKSMEDYENGIKQANELVSKKEKLTTAEYDFVMSILGRDVDENVISEMTPPQLRGLLNNKNNAINFLEQRRQKLIEKAKTEEANKVADDIFKITRSAEKAFNTALDTAKADLLIAESDDIIRVSRGESARKVANDPQAMQASDRIGQLEAIRDTMVRAGKSPEEKKEIAGTQARRVTNEFASLGFENEEADRKVEESKGWFTDWSGSAIEKDRAKITEIEGIREKRRLLMRLNGVKGDLSDHDLDVAMNEIDNIGNNNDFKAQQLIGEAKTSLSIEYRERKAEDFITSGKDFTRMEPAAIAQLMDSDPDAKKAFEGMSENEKWNLANGLASGEMTAGKLNKKIEDSTLGAELAISRERISALTDPESIGIEQARYAELLQRATQEAEAARAKGNIGKLASLQPEIAQARIDHNFDVVMDYTSDVGKGVIKIEGGGRVNVGLSRLSHAAGFAWNLANGDAHMGPVTWWNNVFRMGAMRERDRQFREGQTGLYDTKDFYNEMQAYGSWENLVKAANAGGDHPDQRAKKMLQIADRMGFDPKTLQEKNKGVYKGAENIYDDSYKIGGFDVNNIGFEHAIEGVKMVMTMGAAGAIMNTPKVAALFARIEGIGGAVAKLTAEAALMQLGMGTVPQVLNAGLEYAQTGKTTLSLTDLVVDFASGTANNAAMILGGGANRVFVGPGKAGLTKRLVGTGVEILTGAVGSTGVQAVTARLEGQPYDIKEGLGESFVEMGKFMIAAKFAGGFRFRRAPKVDFRQNIENARNDLGNRLKAPEIDYEFLSRKYDQAIDLKAQEMQAHQKYGTNQEFRVSDEMTTAQKAMEEAKAINEFMNTGDSGKLPEHIRTEFENKVNKLTDSGISEAAAKDFAAKEIDFRARTDLQNALSLTEISIAGKPTIDMSQNAYEATIRQTDTFKQLEDAQNKVQQLISEGKTSEALKMQAETYADIVRNLPELPIKTANEIQRQSQTSDAIARIVEAREKLQALRDEGADILSSKDLKWPEAQKYWKQQAEALRQLSETATQDLKKQSFKIQSDLLAKSIEFKNLERQGLENTPEANKLKGEMSELDFKLRDTESQFAEKLNDALDALPEIKKAYQDYQENIIDALKDDMQKQGIQTKPGVEETLGIIRSDAEWKDYFKQEVETRLADCA